ncbi:MAG: hypothetical protein OFPII_37390 [Osedax symbiont Rs1]|nr:MAG: hypothetical protein OFPII_37390 [Osedax symbiont Rs1]
MKVSLLNKILLCIEIVPTIILLLLSLVLLAASEPLYTVTLIFSILSMISLIYIVIKTILNSGHSIKNRFIYLSHIGLGITILGVLVLLIDGNGLKRLSPSMPFSLFSFGLLVAIPYFHVMLVNNFFISKLKK